MDQILGLLMIVGIRIGLSIIVTMRMVYALQGRKLYSTVIGFFEATLFVLVIANIRDQLDDPVTLIFYSIGFGIGSALAIMLENKIALGTLVATVILEGLDNDDLIDGIRRGGLGCTILSGSGKTGLREVLIISLHRRDITRLRKLIMKFAPEAFVSVELVNPLRGTMQRLKTH